MPAQRTPLERTSLGRTPQRRADELAAGDAFGHAAAVATPRAAGTAAETAEEDDWPSPRRQVAILVRILCGLILLVLFGHSLVPDFRGTGSLVDTFLPWTFVPLLLAVPAALASRSRWAIAVAVLAAGVWAADFGPSLLHKGTSGPVDLTVLSQNVSAQDPDLSAAAGLAVRRGADVVVLQGMTAAGLRAAGNAVPQGYRYHLAMYEFSVWSRYPIEESQPIDLGTLAGSTAKPLTGDSGQFGGLLSFKVQVAPGRHVTVYAVHLPQPALTHSGFAVARDQALTSLIAVIEAEPAAQLIVVGDLDLASTDRGMARLLGSGTGLVSAQAKAGSGFGFTWPSRFPMVRLDDVLVRGLTPVRSSVLGADGGTQAHRPIEAALKF